jgi:hypothetical protein
MERKSDFYSMISIIVDRSYNIFKINLVPLERIFFKIINS